MQHHPANNLTPQGHAAMNRTVALPDPVWLALRDRLAAATLAEAERLDEITLENARFVIDTVMAEFGVIPASCATATAVLAQMRQQAKADRVGRDLITGPRSNDGQRRHPRGSCHLHRQGQRRGRTVTLCTCLDHRKIGAALSCSLVL
ncbi:hypothetical protein [Paracoccus marcusii]|uniref:hypothetical protein n=1 Tax=Paracoccus marcusii TaxID=59779 RepID=UPI003263CB5F